MIISLTAPTPTILERLRIWSDHPVGKLAFPALVSIGTAVVFQLYIRHLDRETKASTAFVNQALQYEKRSLDLLEPLLTQTGPIDDKARAELVGNLIDQSQTLQAATSDLHRSSLPIAERYQGELLEIRSKVMRLQPNKISDFYAASKPFLRDRDRLILDLEPSRLPAPADLPSAPSIPDAPSPSP